MPAPRPIQISYDNPALLGQLAYQSGQAQNSRRQEDRNRQQSAADLNAIMSQISQRNAMNMAAFQASQSQPQAPSLARAMGVQTYGGFSPAGSPTRIQDALRTSGRPSPGVSVVGRQSNPLGGAIQERMVPDPSNPSTGYAAVIGPNSATYGANGQTFTNSSPQTAAQNYAAMQAAQGQSVDPSMVAAIEAGLVPPGGGGFAGPGGSNRIPETVANQLQVLTPYASQLLPEDFQALNAAVRSGGITDANQLINQIEDATSRAQRIRTGEIDPRFQVMSVREHQQEIAILERHKAEMQARDAYGEVDTSPLESLIDAHREQMGQLRNADTQGGESGGARPAAASDTVTVTNGRETYRIPKADLPSAAAEGFQEVK